MDITLDLDAFIAGIEETAPEVEEVDTKAIRCRECDTVLEEVEGDFICPNCNVKATEILQLEETEMQYNEDGRAIVGQRVSLYERKKQIHIDYGWAWSTDEAIVHILGLQIKSLKELGLIDDLFCQGLKNMWHQFWVQYIAPHIQDEYDRGDFVPISVKKALKLRDIEILFKVKDKVMIRTKLASEKRKSYRTRSMMGTQFRRSYIPVDNALNNSNDRNLIRSHTSSNSQELDRKTTCSELSDYDKLDSPTKQGIGEDEMEMDDETSDPNVRKTLTNHCDLESVSILTLNRTLAFIEATARCVNCSIFASDIVRACSQRMIPFFGVHKTLPEEMKINQQDKLMFQKNRPPSPKELTIASTKLIRKIYGSHLPFRLPMPDLDTILQRFLDDMNLPYDLMQRIDDRVTFHSFRKSITKMEFSARNQKIIPQFNILAYAILMIHLKRLFVFDNEEIYKLSDLAREKSRQTGEDLFIIGDWVHHISIKLQLILIYDPYSLFQPIADVKKIEPTSQLYKFIETYYEDRVFTTVRTKPNKNPMWDESFRAELSDFLNREIPRPPQVDKDTPIDDELDQAHDLLHPIQDSFARTSRLWSHLVDKDKELNDLLFKDYHNQKIFVPEHDKVWCAYDSYDEDDKKLEIRPDWPHCFKQLVSTGAYLCFCHPKEVLSYYKIVEAYLYPDNRILRRYI